MAKTKGNILTGEAYFASVTKPNFKFKTDGEYVINVANLDKENKKIASDLGLTIKNGHDKIPGDYVKLSQNTSWPDGGARKVDVLDSEKNSHPSDVNVGNGSIVNVMFDTSDYDVNGNKGVKGWLTKVQVVNLVEYNPDGFDVVPDGYVADKEEVAFAS